MGHGDGDDDDRYNYTQDQIGYSRGPSCFDKVKIGAEMGGAIGLCVGLLLGGFSAFTSGGGRGGLVRTVATIMVQSAGSFAIFMGVGSALRCEGLPQPARLPQPAHLPRLASLPLQSRFSSSS